MRKRLRDRPEQGCSRERRHGRRYISTQANDPVTEEAGPQSSKALSKPKPLQTLSRFKTELM